MKNIIEFSGKNILLTGASVGIGKETAILLSDLGAHVHIIDVDSKGLDEINNLLNDTRHSFNCYDLNDVDGIENLIKSITLNIPIDGFVHCVGVRSRRPFSMVTPKILNEVMNLNFVSFFEIIRSLTKKGRFNEGLSIVGISSISAHRGAAGVVSYAASKSAMESTVRCLSKELHTKKIRLNTVVPSQIDTPAYHRFNSDNADIAKTILERQYLGLGTTSDVANVISFLLSDSSRFITGASIPVDGGFLSS
jgi:NAD(P)-dependent dehydrogenase (short-subunit alcohol dehydrogenase family)